jgi:hypothetical protein
MEASILARREVVQRYGYKSGQGDEHKPLLEGLRQEGMTTTEVGHWTGYSYSWGDGGWHASGSLGSGLSIEQRTKEWHENNTDAGSGRRVLRPPTAKSQRFWQRMVNSVPAALADEWLFRAQSALPPGSNQHVAESQARQRALERFGGGREGASLLSLGGEGDMWQTLLDFKAAQTADRFKLDDETIITLPNDSQATLLRAYLDPTHRTFVIGPRLFFVDRNGPALRT